MTSIRTKETKIDKIRTIKAGQIDLKIVNKKMANNINKTIAVVTDCPETNNDPPIKPMTTNNNHCLPVNFFNTDKFFKIRIKLNKNKIANNFFKPEKIYASTTLPPNLSIKTDSP
jgi:hypothetical protein